MKANWIKRILIWMLCICLLGTNLQMMNIQASEIKGSSAAQLLAAENTGDSGTISTGSADGAASIKTDSDTNDTLDQSVSSTEELSTETADSTEDTSGKTESSTGDISSETESSTGDAAKTDTSTEGTSTEDTSVKSSASTEAASSETSASSKGSSSQGKLSAQSAAAASTLKTVSTVDTKDRIKINVFNYTGRADSNDNTPGISVSGGLQFFHLSYTNSSDYNGYTGSANVFPGIVTKVLGSDGYPILAKGNGGSLAYLFNSDTSVRGKTSVNLGANYLFTEDADGYYEYNSDVNDAVLNTKTNNFTLYSWSSFGGLKKASKTYYSGFFPYASATQGVTNAEGDMASYGMNIGVDFLQPKGGTIKGNDMRFDFSGDDDVWVFIDGILVLDLGGIHQAADGYINFRTGEVSGQQTPTGSSTDTTIYQAFKASGKYTDKELSEMFSITYDKSGNISSASFAGYTKHHMEFYYLERGGDVSNCRIKFNLPALPEKSISVTKNVSALQSDAQIDSTKQYQFQLYSGDKDTNCALVRNTTYKIYENAVDTGKTGTVGSDGIFKLKNGQTAVFPNIEDGTYYFARELNPGSEYSVFINGKQSTATTDAQKNTCYDSPITCIDTKSEVLFHNRYDTVDYNLETGKSVQLKNWDDRTYEITLDAYNTTKTEQAVDLSLVLDTSGSMAWLMDCEVSNSDLKDLSSLSTGAAKLSDLRSQSGWDFKYYAKNNLGEYQAIAWDSNGWHFISGDSSGKTIDSSTGTPSGKYYVKKSTDQTKLTALKSNLSALLKNLRDASSNSKVEIITFAKNASEYQAWIAASDLTDTRIQSLVDGLDSCIAGGTNQQAALELAYTKRSTTEESLKDVILFTDGMPSASGVTVATIKKAADVISALDNTTLFTIGFLSKSNSDYDQLGVNLKSWASGENGALNGVQTAFINASNSALKEAFGSIWAAISYSVKVTVKDYIDSRFEVNEESVVAAGGTVGTDANGTYVIWNGVNASFGSADTPGWSRTFEIKAKETFLGGNNITTNGSGSGVTTENGTTVLFEQPMVNVKVRFEAADNEDTIFKDTTVADLYDASKNGADLSEKLFDTDRVTYTSENKTVLFEPSWMDLNAFSYTWYQAVPQNTKGAVTLNIDGATCYGLETSLAAVLSSQTEAVYYLKTEYHAADASEAAKANSTLDGTVYEVTPQNAFTFSTYTVHVVDGELTITKTFDKEYLANIGYTSEQKELVDAQQSVVFTIEKYAMADVNCTGAVLETYHAVITYDAKNGEYTGKAKLTGLGAGNYKVTEDTDWSWKYVLKETSDTDSNSADGILQIGKKLATGYFGQSGSLNGGVAYAAVTFTNELNYVKKWFSDTCDVVNRLINRK